MSQRNFSVVKSATGLSTEYEMLVAQIAAALMVVRDTPLAQEIGRYLVPHIRKHLQNSNKGKMILQKLMRSSQMNAMRNARIQAPSRMGMGGRR